MVSHKMSDRSSHLLFIQTSEKSLTDLLFSPKPSIKTDWKTYFPSRHGVSIPPDFLFFLTCWFFQFLDFTYPSWRHSCSLRCVSAILLDYRLMTIVKLFPLSGILVDVCEENDLSRNP